MKTENHLRVLKLLSKNVNKSIDYNTDNWIFNYNISQFSSILRIKYDVAYLESLIFVDIEEKKFLENELKCLVLLKDKQILIEPSVKVSKIPLMGITNSWPKSYIFKIKCQFNKIKNQNNFADIKFAIVDGPSFSNAIENEIVRYLFVTRIKFKVSENIHYDL